MAIWGDTERAIILGSGEIPVGWYIVWIGPDDDWPRLPSGVTSHKREVQPSTGRVFQILHVASPIPVKEWPYDDWTVAPAAVDTDPVDAGAFEENPDWDIELGEKILDIADDVKDVAKDAVKGIGSAIWVPAVGVAVLVVGVLWLKGR